MRVTFQVKCSFVNKSLYVVFFNAFKIAEGNKMICFCTIRIKEKALINYLSLNLFFICIINVFY